MTIVRNLGDLANQVDSSGTLGIGGGGTSATNATSGFNALAPSQTSNTNKYLTTNGTNTSWADVVSGMTVTSLSYSGDDQAVDPSNPLPCTLTGTNFVAGSIVYVNTISAANSGTSINVTSSTSITFTPPSGLSAASYNVWIVSPTGTIAILANGILYSGAPSWAGQSTSLSSGGSVSIQLTATGDTPLTYSLVSGTLPTGTTLSSSGLISGTASTAGTFPNIVVKATDPQQQDASVTIEITITLADAYFPYVTMLLHGDGANGAQNNTFIDSSSNNFTITRSGNITQGSFSPYGSNWSNYFDGTGDYLGFSSTSSLSFGSNNFTMECWFYWTKQNTGGNDVQILIANGQDAGGAILAIMPSAMKFYCYYDSQGARFNSTSPTIALNTWNHVAWVRNGTTHTLYLNGSSIGTFTSSGTQSSTGGVGIGYNLAGSSFNAWEGYISNIRLVNGTAVYTSNFTPSTTPLTAITNTQLLTCQSNRFIDNSSNAYTPTVYGNTSIQRFSPFAPTSAYSTATNGGSGYFPRSGSDNLSIASSSAWDLGSDNFTIEAWCYPTLDASAVVTTRANNGSTYPSFELTLYASTWRFYSSSNGSSYNISLDSGIAPLLNVWQHIAVTRNGSTYTIWINGVAAATASSSASLVANGNSLGIGAYPDNSNRFKGYISDLRIVKGTALYSSTFTPNTSPLTAVSNTQLLCNMTNSTIYDNAMMNDLETVGNAQISTSVVKYGTGSISLDGTGDYLKLPASSLYAFGTGDFTIEGWFYINGSTQGISEISGGTTGYWLWNIYLGNMYWQNVRASSNLISVTLSSYQNNWVHFAVVRYSGTTKIYQNGVEIASAADSTNYNGTSGNLTVGYESGTGNYTTGYIDDFRITKGYARYTANFTPPTAAFPNT